MLLSLVLAASLMSLCSPEPIREPERHQVVIVGAGVSGISAAATLLEHKINDIIVLEASDRIGGRVDTVEFGGVDIEKGAEFVHGEKNNAIHNIVNSHDLLVSFDKTSMRTETFFFTNPSGDDFNSTYVDFLLQKAYDLLEGEDLTKKNVSVADFFNSKLGEFFRENKVDPKLAEAIRHIVHGRQCIYNGLDSLSQMGASDDYKETPGDLSLKWKQGSGGYRKLFDFLVKKYPNPKEELPVFSKVKFGKQVTQVKYEDGKLVEVKCADGSSYLADHVIMTVSLGVLKKHADTTFTPALPERKTAAIKSLGFGAVGKVFVLFPTRWWPENVNLLVPLLSNQELLDLKKNTVHGHWMADAVGFYPVDGNKRMLSIWFFGDSCRTMESLTDDQVVEGVMEYAKKTLGKKFNIPKIEKILRSSWATNPFTLGSYSFHSVESDKQHLSNTDLADPLLDNHKKPVVLFAGEATHPHYYSTVHGALETGRREANRLIEYWSKTPKA